MDYRTDDESVLLPAAQAGDQQAFAALLSANYSRLFGLSIRMCGDEQVAKDAVQDASLAAWRFLPGFRGNSTFSTWVYRIALNATLRRMRKRRETPVGDSLELIAGLTRVEGPGVTQGGVARARRRCPGAGADPPLGADRPGDPASEVRRHLPNARRAGPLAA